MNLAAMTSQDSVMGDPFENELSLGKLALEHRNLSAASRHLLHSLAVAKAIGA
jgi:hypothetical protein